MTFPESTYRLQFHKAFTFRDATAIVPYLAQLGVTHAYASPYLKATPGSTHGYDVIDHCTLNPEVGTTADYEAWVAAMSEKRMSHILDIVPNHVGVATNENKWWNDVLEQGQASRFADYFDITWEVPCDQAMRGKVLLPLLGELYGDALEKGQLKVAYENGAFFVHYFARRFPLSPRTYGSVLGYQRERLAKSLRGDSPELQEYENLLDAIVLIGTSRPAESSERVADTEFIQKRLKTLAELSEPIRQHIDRNLVELNGSPGSSPSFDRLDALLSAQNFRLAFWRVAPDEINYRRFFDINDLAALRMENPAVFEATHRFIFSLIDKGKVAGLRIDHPDGLYDPLEYLQRLQSKWLGSSPLYVTVEKILAAEEPLPTEWPVNGTTGYDFLNKINGLFIATANEKAFTKLYESFTGDSTPFAEIVYRKKLFILDYSLASDLHMLANRLASLAHRHRRSRDFTTRSLQEALRQIVACFAVYRTYITKGKVRLIDRQLILTAVDRASQRAPTLGQSIFDFVASMLTLQYPDQASDNDRADQQRLVAKFQQLTAPTTAKGIEDTAFYIYQRFVSLNEVGGDPDRFGISTDEVHRYLHDRQEHWPYALSSLSTHDTKRSEDVRARLNVLSEIPQEWSEQVQHWSKINERFRKNAPDRREEYLLYQTILGALPLDGVIDQSFIERIEAYLLKATREAKLNTSWTAPVETHESAVKEFIAAILTDEQFLRALRPFAATVSRLGLLNSLSQTLLRLSAPGVPDTYQGTEVWDFSLVDPDNRRPVDYAARRRLLDALSDRPIAELLDHPHDGQIKMLLITRLLTARRQFPGLFSEGEYIPIQATGERSGHLFAFLRRYENKTALVVAPRFFANLVSAGEGLTLKADAWSDTQLALPQAVQWENVLTGQITKFGKGVSIASLLSEVPVGIWIA